MADLRYRIWVQKLTIHTSDNSFCSNSPPILELSVKFASHICHENTNTPLDGTYSADFGIDITFRSTNLHHLESQLINIECYILMDVRHDTLFYFVARRILDTLLMSAYLFIFSFFFVVTEMTIWNASEGIGTRELQVWYVYCVL